MENINYSGKQLQDLVNDTGIQAKIIAKKVGWSYNKLWRLYQKDEIPQKKIMPLLILIDGLSEKKNFDYKSEYFILKEKYESLLSTIKSHLNGD